MGFKSYISGLFFLLCQLSHAQQLRFTYIGDKLGLPSQECYNVMQDSKGYVWISTEAGLCRFNGTDCLVFDKKNGLPENSCYAVKEDAHGKVWILTSANRVLYFEDSLKEANFSKAFKLLLINNIQQSYSLNFSKDSLSINTQGATYIAARNGLAINKLTLPAERNNYVCFKTDKNLACYINKIDATGNNTVTVDNENIKVVSKDASVTFAIPNEDHHWRILGVTNKAGEGFIALGHLLIKLDAKLRYTIYKLPHRILTLHSDKDNGLWIGTLKGGVYYYPDTRKMEKVLHNLAGYSVSGVCVDNEKGVWCTTIEKGVFYSGNEHVVIYQNLPGLNKKAEMLKEADGKLYVSGDTNKITRISGTISAYTLNVGNIYSVNDIIVDGDKLVIAGKDFIVRADKELNKMITFTISNKQIAGKQLARLINGRLFAISFANLYELSGNTCSLRMQALPSTANCIASAGESYLLIGCKDGLYKINAEDYTAEKINGIECNVGKIFTTRNNETYIATKQNGIYKYKKGKINALNIKLPTDRFYDIVEDTLGQLWMASNVGLVRLKSGKVSLYTTRNGIPSDEIYKVEVYDGRLYMSSIDGICSIPIASDIKNTTAPPVYLNSIEAGDISLKGKNTFTLTHTHNSLKIHVDALTFKETGETTIFYSLKGLNADMAKEDYVEGAVLSLDNLMPDRYELSIYAVNNDGLKSDQPVKLNFEISKPFWQTAWFFVIISVAGSLLIYFMLRKTINTIKQKEEEKTRINKLIAESQLTALQAQMNPHFIFNAINSIQKYILKKNQQEAYDYLAKFAKLIRLVLNNSQEKALLLKQELEMISLYVELEQLRFSKKFEFNLIVDESVNEIEITVPAMLIQPYIENAIWHGLMHLNKEQKGILDVHISKNENELKVIIEDNGIGREKAEQYKREDKHRSVGMAITEQRLIMINKMQEYENARVVIIDLKDEAGNAKGTRVEIYLPVEVERITLKGKSYKDGK